MTSEYDDIDGWPVVWRPLDPDFEGTDLTFEECAYVGPLPRWLWVRDARRNYCVYYAARTTILKVNTERGRLKYTTMEHDRDTMPQVIIARDGWGNSCRYEAHDPRGLKKLWWTTGA